MPIKPTIEANPIGKATNALEPDIYLLVEKWESENPKLEKKWWEFWKKSRTSIMKVASFFIGCVDYLILKVDKFKELNGPDKKATVLRVIEILYDHIVEETLPMWLKPIAGRIRHLIIHVWISYLIDFIVKKYREGLWRENNEKEYIKGAD
jgi:hypothetical protein